MSEPTDTERLDWLDNKPASLICGGLLSEPTFFVVWSVRASDGIEIHCPPHAVKNNPRAAIDAAMKEPEDG